MPELQIAALREANQTRAEQPAKLAGRVEELERRAGRDSWNSGKPPSSDPIYTKKTKRSVRDRSARKRGMRRPP